MTRYFAYGSNMSVAGMERRCPGATPIGRARLEGWRFGIFAQGFATIVPNGASVVHGVLWRVSPRDLAALNAYEGVDAGLYVRRVVAVRHGDERLPALVYVARNRRPGRVRPGYLADVVAAARDWNLPAGYVRTIERWGEFVPATSANAREPEPGELAG